MSLEAQNSPNIKSANMGLWPKAFGAVLGSGLGALPIASLPWSLTLLFALIFRVRLAFVLIFALIYYGLGYVLPYGELGRMVLELDPLQTLWSRFYNSPWLAISGFNHVETMGGLSVALLSAPLVFMGVYLSVRKKALPMKGGQP